jgi:phenylpyruvate tautomerase PptA (4-oxalocrotonate tautomerase family)
MPLINVKLAKGRHLRAEQQIVTSLTEAMVAIEGENSGASRGRRPVPGDRLAGQA